MSNWSKRLLAVLLFVSLGFSSGCLDYDSGISINKDLSGKATFKMVMDMEPFIMQMVKAMSGAAGEEPPAEFLPMMKAELSKQLGAGMFHVEVMKAKLPAGVTLADSVQKADELKLTMAFTFAFTDINKLPLIEVPMPTRAQAVPGAPQEPLKPFDYVIKDDGTTITITTKAAEKAGDPAAAKDDEKKKAEALAAVNEAKSQLDQLGISEMLKGASIRMQMKFDIPQTVIEQNATRKDGQSYIWEMKLDSFDSIDKMPEPPAMKLKFNKK